MSGKVGEPSGSKDDRSEPQHALSGVDFDRLDVPADIGAFCVSRPTNPSGNVLTLDELLRLDANGNEIPGGNLALRDAFFNIGAVQRDGKPGAVVCQHCG